MQQIFLKHHESPDPRKILESLGACLGQVLDRPAVPLDLFWPAACCTDRIFRSGSGQLLACTWIHEDDWFKRLPGFLRLQDEVDRFPVESCGHFGLNHWHPQTRLTWVLVGVCFPRVAFDLQRRLDLDLEFIRPHILFGAAAPGSGVYFERVRPDTKHAGTRDISKSSPLIRDHPAARAGDESPVNIEGGAGKEWAVHESVPAQDVAEADKANPGHGNGRSVNDGSPGDSRPEGQDGEDLRDRLRLALAEVEPVFPSSSGGQDTG